MKICILLNDITSGGGVERVVCNTSNYLYNELGYDVNIISVFEKKDDSIKYELDKSINVKYILENTTLNNKYSKYKYIYNKCKNIFEIDNYDIIIGCSITLNIISLIWKLMSRNDYTKLVAWEHSQYDHTTKYLNIARKYSYKKMDGIITLTKADSFYFKQGYKNVRCIYNIRSFNSEKISNLDNKNLIAVGRLEIEKGFDMLIEAFKIARQKSNECKSWNLNIFGDGSEREYLIDLINKYDLNNNIKINKFSTKIEDKYTNSSIFVLSSRSESFGMVLVEAMNTGLPCISFACKNGPSEIISDNIDGFLVAPNDINGLADRIVTLVENKEIREKFSKFARKKSDFFDSKNILNEWSAYLNEVKQS